MYAKKNILCPFSFLLFPWCHSSSSLGHHSHPCPHWRQDLLVCCTLSVTSLSLRDWRRGARQASVTYTHRSKVVRGGCKRSFGPREQRSPKSRLHNPRPSLCRCKPILHRCKGLLLLGSNDLLHPSLTTFWNFPFQTISMVHGF